jgi:hypothetical protein
MQGARPGHVASQQADLPREDRIWAGVIWLRVVFGLVIVGGGGVAMGHAWTSESTPWWAVGGTTLMVGVLMVLSGVYARSHPRGIVPHVVVTEEPAEAGEPSMPLLGALLVYKYQVITHRQLREALEEQKKTIPRRRLGEILVLKGLITIGELEEALSFQQSAASDENVRQDVPPGTQPKAEAPAGLSARRPTQQ